METTPRNFNTALEKGEYGEQIVRCILEEKGFIVYKPNTEGAHAFDILAIKDKSKCIAMDVKAKARRNKYADTGINLRHYNVYKRFADKHAMDFWLIFVDEMLGSIYGNTLEKLDEPKKVDGIKYPYNSNNSIRYWPISSMIVIHQLNQKERADLACLSQRSYNYELSGLNA
jgi:hypothetical protein